MTSLAFASCKAFNRRAVVRSGLMAAVALGLVACAELKLPKDILDAARPGTGSTTASTPARPEVKPRPTSNQAQQDGTDRGRQAAAAGGDSNSPYARTAPAVDNEPFRRLDNETPRFARTIEQATSNLESGDDIGQGWPLVRTDKLSAEVSRDARKGAVYAPYLLCSYQHPRGPSKGSNTASFWHGVRPEVSPEALDKKASITPLQQKLTADMVVNKCPPDWSAVMTMVWGPNAKEDMIKAIEARQQKSRASMAAAEAAGDAEYRAKLKAWQAAAMARPQSTAAEEADLRRAIDRSLTAMEANLDALQLGVFYAAVTGDLKDKIVRLAQIAWVKSQPLQATVASRAKVDQWDNDLAGPALTAMDRIERIKYWRANRRVRQAEFNSKGNDYSIERGQWSNVDSSALYIPRDVLADRLTALLAGQELLDRGFMQKAARDLERDRPTGDPGRTPYRYQERKQSWTMTPEEQQAQSPLEKMTDGLVDIIGKTGELLAHLDKLDADARQSRTEFWQCYQRRCDQAGKALYAYSHAMLAKDHHLFLVPLFTSQQQVTVQGALVTGADNIDGGLVWGCREERVALKAALSPARALFTSNPSQAATIVRQAVNGAPFQRWQACRDRLEYIYRPRPTH